MRWDLQLTLCASILRQLRSPYDDGTETFSVMSKKKLRLPKIKRLQMDLDWVQKEAPYSRVREREGNQIFNIRGTEERRVVVASEIVNHLDEDT